MQLSNHTTVPPFLRTGLLTPSQLLTLRLRIEVLHDYFIVGRRIIQQGYLVWVAGRREPTPILVYILIK